MKTPFLAAQLGLATGPAKLAIDAGAPLLAVITVADRRGVFHVYLESQFATPTTSKFRSRR